MKKQKELINVGTKVDKYVYEKAIFIIQNKLKISVKQFIENCFKELIKNERKNP